MKPPSEVGHTVTRAVGRYMSQESLSSLLHDWNATDDAIKRMEEIRSFAFFIKRIIWFSDHDVEVLIK